MFTDEDFAAGDGFGRRQGSVEQIFEQVLNRFYTPARKAAARS
jgi:hypothetical protein